MTAGQSTIIELFKDPTSSLLTITSCLTKCASSASVATIAAKQNRYMAIGSSNSASKHSKTSFDPAMSESKKRLVTFLRHLGVNSVPMSGVARIRSINFLSLGLRKLGGRDGREVSNPFLWHLRRIARVRGRRQFEGLRCGFQVMRESREV
jgi:hypothetical protein